MVAIVAVLVIVLLVIGVFALNMRRSSIEKRSVIGYRKTLGVLSNVVKRSESFGDVHQPTDEEIGQPHILKINPSPVDGQSDAKRIVVARNAPNIEKVPRVKILPSNITGDTKIVFDDFSSSSAFSPTGTDKVKIDPPAPDQDLSKLVSKLRPETPLPPAANGKETEKASPPTGRGVKRTAAQKKPAEKEDVAAKASPSLPGVAKAVPEGAISSGKPSAAEGPLTEVISLAELESGIKSPTVTKRRLDTSGSGGKTAVKSAPAESDGESDDEDGFGFITGSAKLRKISTVAASVVAVAAMAAGIEQLTSGNGGSGHAALVSGHHAAKTNTGTSGTKPKKKAAVPPPVNSGSTGTNGIAPISASPSVVSYAEPKGTYTITIKASSQGQCWVGVQAKANGPYLWMSTISPGSSATYHASGPIVVRVGAPPYATIEVNGLDVSFPKSNVQPFDMVFTPVNSGASSS